MSRGASGILPPAPGLHAAPSTRLSQLLGALSPKPLPAMHITSPCRQHSSTSPHASPGLQSPRRFSPVPSRMSPHSVRHADSQVLSPDKPKAVRRSLLSPGRHRPAQRALLSPERSRAIRNLLPSPGHFGPKYNKQSGAVRRRQDAAVCGDDKLHHREQAHPDVSWGPRPGSATFSNTLPLQAGAAEQQKGTCKAVPNPPRSPFAAVANQLSASDGIIGHKQGGSAADLPARPQSASFSNEMLQQGVPDAPVSKLLLQQHASLPEQQLPNAKSAVPAAATSAEDQLDDRPAASPSPALSAGMAVAPEGGATASFARALDDVPTGSGADKPLEDRPASAFAPVAELPAPVDWRASKQMGSPMAEQLTCAELTDANTQPVCCFAPQMPQILSCTCCHLLSCRYPWSRIMLAVAVGQPYRYHI